MPFRIKNVVFAVLASLLTGAATVAVFYGELRDAIFFAGLLIGVLALWSILDDDTEPESPEPCPFQVRDVPPTLAGGVWEYDADLLQYRRVAELSDLSTVSTLGSPSYADCGAPTDGAVPDTGPSPKQSA
jgi:hypothetical protein